MADSHDDEICGALQLTVADDELRGIATGEVGGEAGRGADGIIESRRAPRGARDEAPPVG